MSNFWLFQGGAETEWLLEDDSPFDKYFWTANKHVKKGDVAFIYLTAPLSRIMATARIVGEPFFNPQATSMFDNPFMYDKWCVELSETVYLGSHDELSIANLRKLFSLDWGWVRYPRGSTIRFRMLQPHELAAAMSFPKNYEFTGNREAKVKQIGNAVPLKTSRALCRSLLAK